MFASLSANDEKVRKQVGVMKLFFENDYLLKFVKLLIIFLFLNNLRPLNNFESLNLTLRSIKFFSKESS